MAETHEIERRALEKHFANVGKAIETAAARPTGKGRGTTGWVLAAASAWATANLNVPEWAEGLVQMQGDDWVAVTVRLSHLTLLIVFAYFTLGTSVSTIITIGSTPS